jgi:hypothetical protein
MMHMGKCYQIKQMGHQKDKKVHGVIKHTEKKFLPGKNIVIDKSTVEFKHKIIFETYNPKNQQSGAADYLHSLKVTLITFTA